MANARAGRFPPEGTNMKRLALLVFATSAFGIASSPAAAQDAAGDRVNTVIVYGDDACPPSTGEEIVVCARLDEGERYRIPEALRQVDNPANESWANRVRSFETVGDFGPMSCSPVGAGGELGCTAQMIAAAYAERRTGPGIRAGELIAAAREERLAGIDAEAAATQARVEELERQYMERLDSGEAQPAPSATPVVVDPADVRP
jgi:hypothetical protein